MSTHKAIATTAKGVLDEITVKTEQPGSDEVLVQTYYSALIPPDTYQLDRGLFVGGYPQILGFAGAGKVVAVGSEVKDLVVGERVSYMHHLHPGVVTRSVLSKQ